MNSKFLETLKQGVLTDSPESTAECARRLGEIIPENQVIGLSGDLGAGKTTFVRGLAQAWGVEQPVTSPTFNLFVSYSGRIRNLVHLDAYRLDRANALDDLMVEDFLSPPWAFVIEWPENLKGEDRDWLLDAIHLSLQIEPGSQLHKITLLKGPATA